MIEPVLLLPTKCVVDERLRLRETPKLLSECCIADDKYENEAVLKVKMTGIVYNKDFELFKLKNFPGRPVVPGNKIVARLHQCANPNVSPGKYLIFPYSNCLLQNSPVVCDNCQFLKDTGTNHLNYRTLQCHQDYQCLYNWEYGLTLDGGLQDYIKVKSPESSLIKVPDTISLHDCCFLLDLALPLYSFLKEIDPSTIQDQTFLIVLNDTTKESNDILIILKHFQISRNQVVLVDSPSLETLDSAERKTRFKGNYNYCLLFNVSRIAVETGRLAVSTGLEATKSRYHMVLFDQYSPQSFIVNRNLEKHNPDITIHHCHLSFKDRLNAVELINIISQLNLATRASQSISSSLTTTSIDELIQKQSRPSVASIDTSSSSISASSIHLNSTTNSSVSNNNNNNKHNNSNNNNKSDGKKRTKTLRFRDDDSIIHPPNNHKPMKNYSWFWYEKDFNLCNDQDQSDDEEFEEKCHTVRQINRLIRSQTHISRVCYTRKTRQTNINALLFT